MLNEQPATVAVVAVYVTSHGPNGAYTLDGSDGDAPDDPEAGNTSADPRPPIAATTTAAPFSLVVSFHFPAWRAFSLLCRADFQLAFQHLVTPGTA
jgi:hypothetical protein